MIVLYTFYNQIRHDKSIACINMYMFILFFSIWHRHWIDNNRLNPGIYFNCKDLHYSK